MTASMTAKVQLRKCGKSKWIMIKSQHTGTTHHCRWRHKRLPKSKEKKQGTPSPPQISKQRHNHSPGDRHKENQIKEHTNPTKEDRKKKTEKKPTQNNKDHYPQDRHDTTKRTQTPTTQPRTQPKPKRQHHRERKDTKQKDTTPRCTAKFPKKFPS